MLTFEVFSWFLQSLSCYILYRRRIHLLGVTWLCLNVNINNLKTRINWQHFSYDECAFSRVDAMAHLSSLNYEFSLSVKNFGRLPSLWGATKHLYNWLCPSVGRSVGRSVTHSFDDPHVASHWPRLFINPCCCQNECFSCLYHFAKPSPIGPSISSDSSLALLKRHALRRWACRCFCPFLPRSLNFYFLN